MALKSILASLDEATEETRSLYVEAKAGDKTVYVLDVEDIDNHPKVRGVITANRENVRKRDEYKSKVDELEARVSSLPEDFDADEWTRLKAGDSGKGDEAIQTLKDQHSRAVEQLKAKHAKELADKDTAYTALDGEMSGRERNDALRSALRDAVIDPKHEDVLVDYLGKSVKVRAENGKRAAYVETDLGEVSVSDYVKDWAKTKGADYVSKTPQMDARGGDRPGGGSRTITRAEFDKMTPQAKAGVDFSKTTLVD